MNPTHGPRSWSLDDRWRSSWRPGAVDCTVWNEHHRTRLACRRPGPGAHRDIERGKVPRAARVACIASSACTSLDQNSNEAGSSGLYCLERAP